MKIKLHHLYEIINFLEEDRLLLTQCKDGRKTYNDLTVDVKVNEESLSEGVLAGTLSLNIKYEIEEHNSKTGFVTDDLYDVNVEIYEKSENRNPVYKRLLTRSQTILPGPTET